MFIFSSKKIALIAVILTTALAIPFAPVTHTTNASDHIDSPQVAQDHGADINDMYFFLDPNDNTKVVMIMTVNPFLISSEIIGQAIFDHNIRYHFEIENTGDAQPDRFVDVRFSRGLGRETGPQTAYITLPNERTFTAPTNVPSQGADVSDINPPALTVTTDAASGVSFFGGVTEDPFFLDNTAANRYVLSSIRNPGNPNREIFRNRAGFNAPDGSDPIIDHQGAAPLQAANQGQSQGPGRDTYAGFNTLTIAISVPVAMLRGTGNELGLNGVTQRQQIQRIRPDGLTAGEGDFVNVDREGNPLVNNALIPASRKDEYNGATTVDDANNRFRADLVRSLQNFGTSVDNIHAILNTIQVRGDFLRLNLTSPNTGPGGGTNPGSGPGTVGRRLQDDVFDMSITMINNGQALGDFVDRNDFVFGDIFPFVAPQVMPNPDGVNSRDTRIRE